MGDAAGGGAAEQARGAEASRQAADASARGVRRGEESGSGDVGSGDSSGVTEEAASTQVEQPRDGAGGGSAEDGGGGADEGGPADEANSESEP